MQKKNKKYTNLLLLMGVLASPLLLGQYHKQPDPQGLGGLLLALVLPMYWVFVLVVYFLLRQLDKWRIKSELSKHNPESISRAFLFIVILLNFLLFFWK
jgi:hypothetical protein